MAPDGARKMRIKEQLFLKTGLICQLCFKRLLSLEHSTLDHIVPKAIGGTWAVSNLRLAHHKCNSEQWTAPPGTIRATMRAAMTPKPLDILEGFENEPMPTAPAPASRPGFKMGTGTPHLHACRWCPGLHSCVNPNC